MTASHQTIEKEIAERIANIVEKSRRINQLARKADDTISDLDHLLRDCRVRAEVWAPPSGPFRLCYTQINGAWCVGIYDGREAIRPLRDEPAPYRVAAARDLPELVDAINRALDGQLEQLQDPGQLPRTPLGDIAAPSILAPEPAKNRK